MINQRLAARVRQLETRNPPAQTIIWDNSVLFPDDIARVTAEKAVVAEKVMVARRSGHEPMVVRWLPPTER